MREELPTEIQEWLQDIDAHRVAAERIGKFYETILTVTRNRDAALGLTNTWMMVLYGFPKNFPIGGKEDGE